MPPVVSDPIYDKKAMSELVICKLSDCSCSVAGGKEIILLCEKVARDDIAVSFFEEKVAKSDGKLMETFNTQMFTNKSQSLSVHQNMKDWMFINLLQSTSSCRGRLMELPVRLYHLITSR